VTVREKFGDAIKYWEPRRLVYNAALAATVLVYFFRGYPASRHNLDVNLVLLIFLLAVMECCLLRRLFGRRVCSILGAR
jgi:ABC-type xylose transport system permease subunit